MRVSKRIITFFLALAMLFSLFTFASAASSSGVLVDSASVTAWNSWISDSGGSSSDYWSYANNLMAKDEIGDVESLDQLNLITEKYDIFSSGVASALGQIFVDLFTTRDYIVMFDSSLGVYRPYDNNAHIWFVNSLGHFPYFGEPQNEEDDGSSPTRSFSWWYRSDIATDTLYSVTSESNLKSIAKDYNGRVAEVADIGNFHVILNPAGDQILTKEGSPLVSIANPDQAAVGQTYNYFNEEGDHIHNEYNGGDRIINEGDTINNVVNNTEYINNSVTVYEGDETTYNQFINVDDHSVNIDGNQYVIDNLYWDESTQTYYVDSHDQYVYNETTNEYETNNYTYQITYDIHYTSVTYIGQTEEYEADTYVYYYELPDGRSSADLTAEDLEQLSLAFTDVVNYARSTDAADMRCLYHFDGNTEDSSYWSYCTEFDWDAGASLTYLDEGLFDGSLYLDETEHEFSITLPNEADTAYAFTFQFRYYQSATEAPSLDSYFSVGGQKMMQFNGQTYVSGSGHTDFASTSVGTWNEICIQADENHKVTFWINGVRILTGKNPYDFVGNEIVFHFGSAQQTYKKLDEMRFTRGMLYDPSADYTPTAVPYDSNLTLILPDGERPVADEVAVVTSGSGNLLSDCGLSDWSDGSVVDQISAGFDRQGNYYADLSNGIRLYNFGSNLSYSGSFVSYTSSGSAGVFEDLSVPQNCLYLTTSHGLNSKNNYYDSLLTADTDYVFTVVYADGTYDSCVFAESTYYGPEISSTSGIGRMLFMCAASGRSVGSNDYYTNGLVLAPMSAGDTLDIVYMELRQGTEADYTIVWETAMYTSGELENSPVLAVRSNTPISSYTFGGVRPTYPDRGQVWAMIEGHRIVSLQQYTGSAWIEVDGRIWTGKRWIPYGSFDVFTLQDCWDIVGSGEDSDYEYIYSEAGFWSWLQKSLLKMMDKLDAIIVLLGGDPENIPGGSSGNDQDQTFWQRVKKIFEDSLAKIIEGLLDLITKVLDVVLKLVYDLLAFFFGLLSDTVVNGIGDFFDTLTDKTLLEFFQIEEPVLGASGDPILGDDGNPVTVTVVSLPAGVAGVFAFISATVMVLPGELRAAIFFGIGALLVFAVLKLFKL